MPSLLEAEHPAVVLIQASGDYLLNLPALRALAHVFHGRLALVCRPGIRSAVLGDVHVTRSVEPVLDFSTLDGRFDARWVAERLGPCDLLLSLNPWHARCTRELLDRVAPATSVGYHRDFDIALHLDFTRHNAELGFDLARELSPRLEIENFAGPPALDPVGAAAASRLLENVPPGWRVYVVHAETKPDKMWAVPRLVAVLDWLLDRSPEAITLDLGVTDLGLDRGVHGGRVVPCNGLPLAAAVALIGRADLFLGVDSCLLHAADLFRVPSVGLFGPTDPHEFGLRFTRHRHVKGPSMDQIQVEAVIEAVCSLLQEVGDGPH